VLDETGVKDLLRVSIEEVVKVRHVQARRDRPGQETLYKQVKTIRYKIRVEDNEEGQREAQKEDGLFALMSNDKKLTVAQALAKYKYQPNAEKRNEQLKGVFGVRPVWLKSGQRVESLLWLYHLVEVVQALLERVIRRQMVIGAEKGPTPGGGIGK